MNKIDEAKPTLYYYNSNHKKIIEIHIEFFSKKCLGKDSHDRGTLNTLTRQIRKISKDDKFIKEHLFKITYEQDGKQKSISKQDHCNKFHKLIIDINELYTGMTAKLIADGLQHTLVVSN